MLRADVLRHASCSAHQITASPRPCPLLAAQTHWTPAKVSRDVPRLRRRPWCRELKELRSLSLAALLLLLIPSFCISCTYLHYCLHYCVLLFYSSCDFSKKATLLSNSILLLFSFSFYAFYSSTVSVSTLRPDQSVDGVFIDGDHSSAPQ